MEGLVSNVKRELHRGRKSGRETMGIVDNLKRLCIDHYFQEEIEDAITSCSDLLHSDNLLDTTLAFRLLREAGYDVSADDVLRRFTDIAGEFNIAAIKVCDVMGLLSLHDVAQLSVRGEVSLEKARLFSCKHLASAMRHLEPGLARYVRQSLEHPNHRSPAQFKARHHLSYLQTLPIRNTAMEELAAAEFQLKKLLHQKEMKEVERWWLDLGLANEIPLARDQVLKWYMSSLAVVQESPSKYRIQIAKTISLVYVVDDIFDLVGTLEELSFFTQAIKMWDLAAAADSLPRCMRSCYKALYTITNEIADMAEEEHRWNPIDHLKKAWTELFDGFMVEARWLATGQVPTADDYLRNGVVTSGVPLIFAHILFLLGQHDDDQAAALGAAAVALKVITEQNHSGAISCVAKILRLWDDMGSAKDEAQEGVDGSYRDLYLAENPSCTISDAEEHMRRLIEREWEELNRECFSRRTTIAQACLNAARMVSLMYAYDSDHKLPALEDYTRMLLL